MYTARLHYLLVCFVADGMVVPHALAPVSVSVSVFLSVHTHAHTRTHARTHTHTRKRSDTVFTFAVFSLEKVKAPNQAKLVALRGV